MKHALVVLAPAAALMAALATAAPAPRRAITHAARGPQVSISGATGAEVCTAGDSSCLLHSGGGLGRTTPGTRAVHLAEILASTR